jgi:hypothetical protein
VYKNEEYQRLVSEPFRIADACEWGALVLVFECFNASSAPHYQKTDNSADMSILVGWKYRNTAVKRWII